MHPTIALLLSRYPNDIRFTFPREGKILWANSKLLEARCGDDWSIRKLGGDKLERSGKTEGSWTELGDSSSEGSSADVAGDGDADSCEEFWRVIVIRHTFNTYHNALVWLTTGYLAREGISAPSTLAADEDQFCRPMDTPAILKDIEAQQQRNRETALLPTPVSPVQLYALAEELGLPALRELALRQFKEELTLSTAPSFLLDPFISRYEEVTDAVVEFAATNWQQLKYSPSMAEVVRSVESGAVDINAEVLMKLMMKL